MQWYGFLTVNAFSFPKTHVYAATIEFNGTIHLRKINDMQVAA